MYDVKVQMRLKPMNGQALHINEQRSNTLVNEITSTRLLQSYVDVIDDIAQDIGYLKGAQAEMIEPLLCRMAEHIHVFGAKKVVFSKMTRVYMKRLGVSKRDIKRVSTKKVSE